MTTAEPPARGNATVSDPVSDPAPTPDPARSAKLDADAVRRAYRRWARSYDTVFGAVSAPARRRAVAAVNAAPGTDVLEMGVGTGLGLPLYAAGKRVTGIDLSPEMLDRARARVARLGLANVAALELGDAEATPFADGSFDVAIAMFVASVVPHPDRLLAEMRRVVRPGGRLLFCNHFAATGGARLAVERGMAPLARALGWHPDFALGRLLPADAVAEVRRWPLPPGGLFTLVSLPNLDRPAPVGYSDRAA